MKQHVYWLVLCLLASASGLRAQQTFPYNGVYDQREGHYAFTNATLVPKAGEEIKNATLVIRNGKIVALGSGVATPRGAVVVDLKGKYIYPSLIDSYTSYGLPETKEGQRGRSGGPQELSSKPGAYAWNEALRPEQTAHSDFKVDAKTAKAMRELGFGTVVTHRKDGISRGTGSVVTLAEEREHRVIIKERAGHFLSFRKGSSSQDYPSSLMGSIALLRQTYLDGRWYANKGRAEEVNLSLEAWNRVQDQPQVFEVNDWQNALRAQRLADEFDQTYILRGGGDEYRRLDALKATGATFILPLQFPEAYDVSDPYDALNVSLEQLLHWELAPANAARVAAAGIPFALTADGLKKITDFPAMVRQAIEQGLSEAAALRALTEVPAQLFGVADQVGTLAKGKLANFIVTSGPLFAKDAVIYQNWVQGQPYLVKELDATDLSGVYTLTVGNETYQVRATGQPGKNELQIEQTADSSKVKVKSSLNNDILTLNFRLADSLQFYQLSGTQGEGVWSGRGRSPQGQWVNWRMTPAQATTPDDKKADDKKEDEPAKIVDTPVNYPLGSFGLSKAPVAGTYLITNATVWTSEEAGKLLNTDVLVRNGKIAAIGSNLSRSGATVIDGTDKHLTAGIIDEHTHIGATGGINEGTQASSAEVRIGDVVDATDVDIYRQLAGGVTSAQILHGSANPIGGQSAIIKMRWGTTPQQMLLENAPGFIKFALGENVKQANWGSDYTSRFPQTRMGVEQVYESYFTRAREYGERKASGQPYRPDLELEALYEILQDKRFISCHSYQQGEINMLIKVAERHNFRVNTFTHILEGYKVADQMAEHGAGGSTFSDWWAYKFEVIEAIPHNAALMHQQGVTVAINSDDAEMARRLNQEAAKSVLFGGVSEEDALNFVTLNAAKLLHIDDRVGSIKVGKDADLVLWTDHPLSVYARAEKTMVDGKVYYDMAEDNRRREMLSAERNRLVQKMLASKEQGKPAGKPVASRKGYYHCDTLGEYGTEHHNH